MALKNTLIWRTYLMWQSYVQKTKHIDMLEKFYTNIVKALKRAASEVLTNSPKQKHNVPGWTKDVREKHKAARQAYLYWIDNHKPKSGPLFDITKESKKEFKYALRACRKSRGFTEQISQKILAGDQKKQEIMASIYSGRRNRKQSSHCHVEKTLFSIAELIKKLWELAILCIKI